MQETIKNESWYFGACTKDMIENILVSRGDFLVRLVQNTDSCWLVLHVKNDNSVDNFRIGCTPETGKFVLPAAKKDDAAAPEFDSPLQLIKYYREHRLPNKLRLHHGIRRPSWLIPQRDVEYNAADIMGTGNFSEVFRGKLKIRAGQAKKKIECAIKVLKKDVAMNANLIKFLDEARLHTVYDHENVVQMLGVMLDCMPMMMIMELCHGGSLDKHLQKRGKQISAYEKEVYLLEAAMGMRYLHSQGCIHRDLAARNCLIGDDGRVKIGDFGLSLFSPDGETVNVKMQTVPLRWMAPECLRRDQSFSFKTDIWAYGVLIFEVFSNGSKPFADYETDSAEWRMIKAIKKAEMPPAPDGTPNEVASLMKQIWQKESNSRPDFVQIVLRFCSSVKLETAVPLGEMVVNELKGVQKTQLPDFDWTEEKAREEEMKKKKAEAEEYDRLQAEKKKKRDEFRAKRDILHSTTTTGSKSKEQRSYNDTPTEKSEPSQPIKNEGKPSKRQKNTKWLKVTITKLKGLKGTKKDHNVVMEKQVAEVRKKDGSIKESVKKVNSARGSHREKKKS